MELLHMSLILPKHFSKARLSVLSCNGTQPLPIHRKPWNEETLFGCVELRDSVKMEGERGWYRKLHAEAAIEAGKHWWVDMQIVVCVVQKGKKIAPGE